MENYLLGGILIVLLGIWRAVSDSAHHQKQAAEWLQFIAKPKSSVLEN
jgi:hypothetical protein